MIDDRFIIFPIQNPKGAEKLEKILRRGLDKDFKYSIKNKNGLKKNLKITV